MRRRYLALALGVALVVFAMSGPNGSSAFAAGHSAHPTTCLLGRLTVAVPSASAGGGAEGMLIVFRNDGESTCTLEGFPDVVATRPGKSFTAIPSTSTYLGGLAPGTRPLLIALKPGGFASVVVAAGDNPETATSPQCVHERYESVTVSIPGKPGSKRLSAVLPGEATTLPSCTEVEVTPFQSSRTWFAR